MSRESKLKYLRQRLYFLKGVLGIVSGSLRFGCVSLCDDFVGNSFPTQSAFPSQCWTVGFQLENQWKTILVGPSLFEGHPTCSPNT